MAFKLNNNNMERSLVAASAVAFMLSLGNDLDNSSVELYQERWWGVVFRTVCLALFYRLRVIWPAVLYFVVFWAIHMEAPAVILLAIFFIRVVLYLIRKLYGVLKHLLKNKLWRKRQEKPTTKPQQIRRGMEARPKDSRRRQRSETPPNRWAIHTPLESECGGRARSQSPSPQCVPRGYDMCAYGHLDPPLFRYYGTPEQRKEK